MSTPRRPAPRSRGTPITPMLRLRLFAIGRSGYTRPPGAANACGWRGRASAPHLEGRRMLKGSLVLRRFESRIQRGAAGASEPDARGGHRPAGRVAAGDAVGRPREVRCTVPAGGDREIPELQNGCTSGCTSASGCEHLPPLPPGHAPFPPLAGRLGEVNSGKTPAPETRPACHPRAQTSEQDLDTRRSRNRLHWCCAQASPSMDLVMHSR